MNTTIMLDKERTLKFTLNSLIKFEQITGKSMSELGDKQSLEIVLALIYVGLIHEDKDLTLEAVGDLITLDKLDEINVAITQALTVVK